MDAIEVLLLWVVGCSVVVFLIVERLDSVQKERETGIGSSVLEESCRGEEEQSGADWQVVSDDSKRADFQEVAEEKENPVYDDGEEEEEEETEYSVSVSGQKSGFCCDILDISGNNVDGLYDDGGVEYEFLDDWEGIERTELDKIFGEAMVFVGSKSNADQIADLKLQLYGLQRIALQGPCHRPQPMALNVSARAKWESWKKLGNMSREAAMEKYVDILSEAVPAWKGGDIHQVKMQKLVRSNADEAEI